MDTPKKWYKSKTIWANALMIAGSIFAMASEQISQGAGLGVIVINSVNIILRAITKEPIEQ